VSEEPVVSLVGADHIIDAVGVNVSVVGTLHVAPVGEGLPGVGVEVTVTERWLDEMHGLVVAKHVFCSGVSSVIPEVGVSGDSTLTPVHTVVDGWAKGSKSSSESRPMSAFNIITGDIFLAITVDVSPCGP